MSKNPSRLGTHLIKFCLNKKCSPSLCLLKESITFHLPEEKVLSQDSKGCFTSLTSFFRFLSIAMSLCTICNLSIGQSLAQVFLPACCWSFISLINWDLNLVWIYEKSIDWSSWKHFKHNWTFSLVDITQWRNSSLFHDAHEVFSKVRHLWQANWSALFQSNDLTLSRVMVQMPLLSEKHSKQWCIKLFILNALVRHCHYFTTHFIRCIMC